MHVIALCRVKKSSHNHLSAFTDFPAFGYHKKISNFILFFSFKLYLCNPKIKGLIELKGR